MKRCPVCGCECANEELRCIVCNAILPTSQTSVGVSSQARARKVCSCGAENNIYGIRCTKCGKFLRDVPVSHQYENATTVNSFDIICSISSGGDIHITEDTILGRMYQNNLWDPYSSRAAYRIHFDENSRVILIDKLKKKTSEPLRFNCPYKMGLKTIMFSRGEIYSNEE